MDTIKEGLNKKWQIRLYDKTIGKMVEWIGHSDETKLMICFRMINLLVGEVNKLREEVNRLKEASEADGSYYDEGLRKIVRKDAIEGDDYLDRR